jgi:hypothetical protein
MAEVDDRWRMIPVAGYNVTFRFADPRKPAEPKNLRHVGRLDPIDPFADD